MPLIAKLVGTVVRLGRWPWEYPRPNPEHGTLRIDRCNVPMVTNNKPLAGVATRIVIAQGYTYQNTLG